MTAVLSSRVHDPEAFEVRRLSAVTTALDTVIDPELDEPITDLGFVRSDGKTHVPQPHLHFEDSKMWTLDDVRGHKLGSPLKAFRALTPEQREVAVTEYRKGFKINPCN